MNAGGPISRPAWVSMHPSIILAIAQHRRIRLPFSGRQAGFIIPHIHVRQAIDLPQHAEPRAAGRPVPGPFGQLRPHGIPLDVPAAAGQTQVGIRP